MIVNTEEQSATWLLNEAIKKCKEGNPQECLSTAKSLGILISQPSFDYPDFIYQVASFAFQNAGYHSFNRKFKELWKEQNPKRDYSKDIQQRDGLLTIPLTGKESVNDLKDMWAALDAAPRPANWPDNNKEASK